MEIVLIVGMIVGFTLFGLYVSIKTLCKKTDSLTTRDLKIDVHIAKLRKTYGDMLRRLSK